MYFIAVEKTRQLSVREGGIICYIKKNVIRKGYFFYQNWCIKGYGVGPRGGAPRVKFC